MLPLRHADGWWDTYVAELGALLDLLLGLDLLLEAGHHLLVGGVDLFLLVSDRRSSGLGVYTYGMVLDLLRGEEVERSYLRRRGSDSSLLGDRGGGLLLGGDGRLALVVGRS